MPTCAQSRCLPATYECDPGSSPTRIVPSPGTIPCAASAATRSFRSALTAAAVALPSRICAVTLLYPSVVEVPDTREVQRDTRRSRRFDHAFVPDGAARFGHLADTCLRKYLETVR